jgi:hypothetical protein
VSLDERLTAAEESVQPAKKAQALPETAVAATETARAPADTSRPPVEPAQLPVDTRRSAFETERRAATGPLRLLGDPRAPWLALAVIVAFGLIQEAVRFHDYHLGLVGDDYDFLLGREGISFHILLQPHNENLSAVGILLYKAIFAVVGISTAVPYIALLLLSMAACAVLSYVFVKRELGPWVALIAPLLLVTLGPAAEALLWPFEFTLLSALAFWLGAMLLIERGRARTDAIGCALLILSIGSQSLGVALLPASALALVLWRGWRKALRSAWTVGLPLVLYVAWYEAYHPYVERNLAKVPDFIVDSFTATVGDLSGLGNTSYGVALAIVVLIAVGVRCLYLRRVPSTTIYVSVALLTIWLAAGLSEGPGRVAPESRYQFHNSLLFMLALAPLAPRLQLARRPALKAALGLLAAVLVGVIVAANFGHYRSAEEGFRATVAGENAELAALQVARPAVLAPDQPFTGLNELFIWWPFTPRAYYNAIDADGSPVNVHRDLELASQPPREAADIVLVHIEGLTLQAASAPSGTVRPRSASHVRLQPAAAGCGVIPAGAASETFQVLAPPGGLGIHPAAGPPVKVGVARFSEPPASVELGSVGGASEAVVRTRPDASSVPWRFQLTAQQAVTVCSLAE